MGNDSIDRLPTYPSTQARKSLSPTQLATLNQTISSSLLQTIALPPSKRDSPAARTFVASYAKDTALQFLQGLIWAPPGLSKEEKIIRKRALTLAEKIAASRAGLGIQSLLDIAIIYAPTNISQVKALFETAVKSDETIVKAVETDLVPAFTHLFNPAQGLYAIRKAAHCISSFLHASPPEIVRSFSHSKAFVLALATLYDQGLATIAHSYGGLSVLRNQNEDSSAVDEWEPIWVQTKVDLIDAFHVLITTLLNDISSAGGRSLAHESERTFDIIFALLEIPPSSPASTTVAVAHATPYLDRPLLTDYQDSYSLSKSLASALQNAAEKDARLDLLESRLQSLEASSTLSSSSGSRTKDAGVLKILISSSGITPGIDNRGNGGRVRSTADAYPQTVGGSGKGKEKAPEHVPAPSHIPDIDIKTTQVLDILPEHPPEYVRALLEYPSYSGNPEKVIEALLEGTAPSFEEMEPHTAVDQEKGAGGSNDDFGRYVSERRNIFDDEEMDFSQLRIGKRSEDASTVLKDRTFIEQMKADILRRAEEISDDEEEEEVDGDPSSAPVKKGIVLAFDDEEDVRVKVGGDGEESDESDDEAGGNDGAAKPQNVETILELAYIRDPKLFDRDAATRRSKGREELKKQTGWDDQQIEGWRIMLERNPRKDKILEKHEFAGNQNWLQPAAGGSGGASDSHSHGGRGGRGGGRGRGGGGGARGGRGGGGEAANSARERAWKDKNKASRGNHNRKRGHDKKMARAGAGVPPA
ncbi:hypothetical protein DXG03_000572 [Asterophora parasitica]|uniref:CUE domain-containing protein n=1 Tax=Asterophora parasitica TaxID=117018 RepID=A0A9P7K9P2_9AGAR|nr:hypothetical protein DXG03_000572 [Asterophora parasitica]